MSSAAVDLSTLPLRTLQVVSSAAIDLATLPFRALAGPRTHTTAEQGASDSFAYYLERILKYPDGAKITVRDLLGGLESRAFGLPLAVLSAGEVVPIPVPGFTFVISVPLAAIGAQMIVDRKRLWLPNSLLNRRLPARQVKRIARAMLPAVRPDFGAAGVDHDRQRRTAAGRPVRSSPVAPDCIAGSRDQLAAGVDYLRAGAGIDAGGRLVDCRRHGSYRGRRCPDGNCCFCLGRRRFWRLTLSA